MESSAHIGLSKVVPIAILIKKLKDFAKILALKYATLVALVVLQYRCDDRQLMLANIFCIAYSSRALDKPSCNTEKV